MYGIQPHHSRLSPVRLELQDARRLVRVMDEPSADDLADVGSEVNAYTLPIWTLNPLAVMRLGMMVFSRCLRCARDQ